LHTTSAHYARLGQQEREKIHVASLEILERVGVDVHDEQARETLIKGGAKADGIRVRIPEHVVEKALALAPKRMTLYDRNGKVAMRAWGYNIYYGEGLPLLYIPLNAGGVNSPTTTAGCMASMNAGILLGIVLAQLVREGTPVAVPGWNGGPYNLKTMVGNYVLADEQGVPTEMGKYYNLPVFGLGGSTDAKVLDQQCGAEVTLSLFTALLHGTNIVHDVGFMDSGLQGSLQLIAIANDLIGWLRAATSGVVVNEETLALDVVDELGPTGDYLSHAHTLKHFKEPYYSRLADISVGGPGRNDDGRTGSQTGGRYPVQPQAGPPARRRSTGYQENRGARTGVD
jgi:trimethylamine:corrinoid methyltransferase-like protein